jgi:hypothetical protein
MIETGYEPNEDRVSTPFPDMETTHYRSNIRHESASTLTQYKSLQCDRSFEAANVSRETERVLAGGGDETDGIGATLASAYANYRDDPRTERVQASAFWLAVVLPVVHLSLLVTGLSNAVETALFVGLVGLNVVALVGGHAHRA